MNGNNEFYQNSMINARKDNDEWKNAAETCPSGNSATLIEKSITENGTYDASDDNADGYSSVTVNVPFTFNKIYSYAPTSGAVEILNIDSNDVSVNALNDDGASFTLPIRKLMINQGPVPYSTWVFVPTEDFDGIYLNGTKITFTGDTVIPGEGVYEAEINQMTGTYTITTLFPGNRTPFSVE